MFKKLRQWVFGKEKATVVCARVGESLALPPGSVEEGCGRCNNKVTIAPATFRQLAGKHIVIICAQCAAAENPNAVMPIMSLENTLDFIASRGGFPDQSQIRTIGDMNKHMDTLFPNRSQK